MTDPNLTPRADTLTDARLTAFRDAIAAELKGTPLDDLRVSARNDEMILDATVIRARVGLIVEGAVRLDNLAVNLAGFDYFGAHAVKLGQGMRAEWDRRTGAVERRSILRQAVIDLTFAVGEREHESRDRRLEGVIAQLEGLMR